MQRRSLVVAFGVMCAAILAPLVMAGGTPLKTQLVANGFTLPTALAVPPSDYERMFVVEKGGKIRIIKNGAVLATPFLDITSIVNSTTLEWGLLNMCFDPGYATNGFFYVYYSEIGTGNSIIARYHVSANPDVADAASRQVLLFLVQPSANHRGSWMAFGRDGYMYLSFGDGGGQNDPSARAQNIGLLQGKLLRIDPNGPDNVYGTADDDAFPADPNKNYAIPPTNPFVGITGEDEIWAYGVRNPWRCSFDRLTGDLWIGDVGQNQREEVDFQPANNDPNLAPGQPGYQGGKNYGWRCTEGTFCTGLSGCTCNGPTLTPPIYEYNHTVGLSITGGFVYRGCAIPDLVGTYFFAEYQLSKLFSLRYDGTTVTSFEVRTTELQPGGGLNLAVPSTFGEDNYGELYICDYSGGEVFKIVPATFVGPDCDANLVNDACQIVANPALDANNNGILDACEPPPVCVGDANGDGAVNAADLSVLLGNFNSPAAGPGFGDFNGDGQCNGADLSVLLGAFGTRC